MDGTVAPSERLLFEPELVVRASAAPPGRDLPVMVAG
jgi:hypothetical protein